MSPNSVNHPPDPTFESLSQRPKLFSEAFILNAISNSLEITPGEHAYSIKSYLDHVPADETDRDFFSNPDTIADFRDQSSDFIASHLKIRPFKSVSDAEISALKSAKTQYITHTLNAHKRTTRQYLHDLANGARPDLPRAAYGFHGLHATGPDGNTVDLLHTALPNMRANIWVQDQVFSQFIQWRSDKFVLAKLRREDPGVTRRIYLNPRAAQAIPVFEQIVDKAEAQDLMVAGKFLDRYTDGISAISSAAHGNPAKNSYRGDGIVFYANEASANNLLSIVKDVYMSNQDAFRGRQLSKTPLRIAEGVGIGDEVPGSSLTADRARVLEQVISAVREELSLSNEKVGQTDPRKQKIIEGFDSVWVRIAAENGIDPHNLAFNKN